MKRNITKRGGWGWEGKNSDAQCNCSPPADRCPVSSRAAIHTSRPTPPVYILGMTFHGMEYPFG